MYRDNSLVPKEAIRLAALGLLAERDRPYGDLAREVREFAARIVGPSLELLGTSIELLRFEGLIAPVDGQGMADAAVLRLTDAGRARSEEHTSELQSLMRTSYAVFCLKKKKKATRIRTLCMSIRQI